MKSKTIVGTFLFCCLFLTAYSKTTITYFNFRGRGEFIRLIFEYAKEKYHMDYITYSEWKKDKRRHNLV